MVTTCNDFYKVDANGSCYDIAASHDIPLASFYDWNPAVQTDCSGLQANEYVCVGTIATSTTSSSSTSTTASSTDIMTPTPIQTGIVNDCTKFYKVKADDGCYDIADAEGIALDDLYAWNPAVKTDCSGLQAKAYICVGVTAKSSSAERTGTAS